jgi:hypothetical protein
MALYARGALSPSPEQLEYADMLPRLATGGEGLRLAQREATAMRDALAVVRALARKRSLRSFDVDDAVFVLISLTLSPLSQQSTFMVALDRDLEDAAVRRQHVRLMAEQMLHLLGAPDAKGE